MAGTRREREQSRAATIRRRARTVPAVIVAFALVTILLPLLLVIALLTDAVRRLTGGPSLVATRLALFGWVWLASEAIGVLLLFGIWLAAGGGVAQERMVRHTYRVQALWTATLWGAVRRLFALSLEVEGADAPGGGPVIVMIRHASIVDNLIPANLITRPHGLRLRYILKRELLSDPCLDVAGSRLPNFFVARESGGDEGELAGVRALAAGVGADGLLIYPEGTRFSAQRLARAVDKLAEAGLPELSQRAARLRHLLPPRIGGPITLLDAAPEADVVVCAHHGLDGFSHLSDIWAGGLTGRTIKVRFQRFGRSDIPDDRDARVIWVYDRWQDMDDWIEETT